MLWRFLLRPLIPAGGVWRRYHDLGTLLSFDKSELLDILIDDLGLTPEEAKRFLDASP